MKIKRVGILGSGIMGSGIAEVAVVQLRLRQQQRDRQQLLLAAREGRAGRLAGDPEREIGPMRPRPGMALLAIRTATGAQPHREIPF